MNGVLNLEYCIYLQFTFIAQLFSCQMFLTPDSIKRREHFGWFLALKIIVDIFVSFIAYLILFFFGSNFWSMLLTYTGMFLFSSLSYLFIFDADFKDAIYITTIGYVFQHIAYKANFLAFDMHTKVSIQNNAYQGVYPSYSSQTIMVTYETLATFGWNILFQFLIYAAIDTILYFIFAKKFKNNYKDSITSLYTLEITFVSLSITVLVNTFYLFVNDHNVTLSVIIAVLTILVCLFILYNCSVQMELFSSKREKILLENQYKEKIKQYELSKESVDLINIKCHDLRKQIRYLKANNKGSISNEELTKIENAIRIYDTSIKTGNDIIDTILQEKSLIMNKNEIVGTFLINGESLLFMEKEDVYALFGNIIDNAIEALSKIEDKDKRTFSLKASKSFDFITIEETNFFTGKIDFSKDGLPKTSKDDKNYHGYGTKSIVYVIKKLHGKVSFTADESTFTVKAVIPIKE